MIALGSGLLLASALGSGSLTKALDDVLRKPGQRWHHKADPNSFSTFCIDHTANRMKLLLIELDNP